MSVQDTSLNPKILESAKQEFLEKGFEKTMLKQVCENAQVTTGALYKRYKGKEDLFYALVEPTIAQIQQLTEAKRDDTYEQAERGALPMIGTSESLQMYMEFAYANYDGLRLLLCCAGGTKYANFLHEYIEDHTEKTYEVLKVFQQDNVMEKDVLHLLLTAFWVTFFEPIVHEFPKEKALYHCNVMAALFNWDKVFKNEGAN